MRALIIAAAAALFVGSASAQPAAPHLTQAQIDARIHRILRDTPLIDGHNDLAWEIRSRDGSDFAHVDLNSDLSHVASPKPDDPFSDDRHPASRRAVSWGA